MNPALSGIVAISFYLLGSYSQVRNLRNRTVARQSDLVRLALFALFFHGLFVYSVLWTESGIDLSFFNVAALISFAISGAVLLASIREPVHNLYVFVFLISVLAVSGCLVVNAIATGPSATPRPVSPPLFVHIVASVIAYSILTLAACQSILVLTLERRIRNRVAIDVFHVLPPLETLEAMLFRFLWAGLGILTISIATGFVFLSDKFSEHLSQHHTVLSVASWIVYASLLTGHVKFGWRGVTTTRWSLMAFGLLALAYFGTKFVIEFLLQRG
ncbi:MAG: cytochrome c biogenesis protein CcsA [Pseudomonadales bacterium]